MSGTWWALWDKSLALCRHVSLTAGRAAKGNLCREWGLNQPLKRLKLSSPLYRFNACKQLTAAQTREGVKYSSVTTASASAAERIYICRCVTRNTHAHPTPPPPTLPPCADMFEAVAANGASAGRASLYLSVAHFEQLPTKNIFLVHIWWRYMAIPSPHLLQPRFHTEPRKGWQTWQAFSVPPTRLIQALPSSPSLHSYFSIFRKELIFRLKIMASLEKEETTRLTEEGGWWWAVRLRGWVVSFHFDDMLWAPWSSRRGQIFCNIPCEGSCFKDALF